jgi:adenine-specific DNA-methyltransferase
MPLNTNLLIKKMVFLRKGQGKALLPKCGNANFMPYFNRFLAIEADPAKCPKGALNLSIFDLSADRTFQAIVSILPQVSYKNIDFDFKDKLHGYDKNTNLYIFYVDKCLQHLEHFGEMILQTPADFLKSCPLLNKKLFALGTITDIIDAGRAGQIVWRFVKGDHSKRTLVNGEWKKFTSMNGQLMFLNREYTVPFRDLFSIKVGAISGCDEAFPVAGRQRVVHIGADPADRGYEADVLQRLHGPPDAL